MTIGKQRIFLVIAVYTAVLTVSEILYRHLFGIPPVERIWQTAAFAFLFVVLFGFARYRAVKVLIAVLFALSLIANNIHYAIYQSWINGINYYLMLVESREVWSAGVSMAGRWIVPLLYALAETAFFLSLCRFLRTTPKFRTADFIFVSLILFIIIRSFSTTHDQGTSPDNGYSRLKSHYYSFGYFIGRVLPSEILDLHQAAPYRAEAPVVQGAPPIRNIILIMGESESANHVSYFGYQRETTPFFKELSQQYPGALIKPTYSAGVMTAVSLPLFFNAVPYPNGVLHINQGISNMFRLAKEQGFDTQFHSSQPETEMEIINLIGRKWIDTVSYPTDFGYRKTEAMPDTKLLPLLEKIDLENGRHFIVLHQRGSHVPYASQLSPDEIRFPSGSPLDNYDSTIYANDLFIKEVFHYLGSLKHQDWLLIYTSDHGQNVNDDTFYQGKMEESGYLVPTLLYSPQQNIRQEMQTLFKGCDRLFHQQVSAFIIRNFGYDFSDSGCKEGVVTYNLLSGDAGWRRIHADGSVENVRPKR